MAFALDDHCLLWTYNSIMHVGKNLLTTLVFSSEVGGLGRQ